MHEPPGAHENEVKPVVSSIMLPALQVEPLKVAVSLSQSTMTQCEAEMQDRLGASRRQGEGWPYACRPTIPSRPRCRR